MAIKRKEFNTTAIRDLVYPLIDKALSYNLNPWKKCIANFLEKRSTALYDIAPCDRIYFGINDINELFSVLGINESDIINAISQTYYSKIDPFKPGQAKDPCSVVVMCIVRYFLLAKDNKNLELAMVYQSFSGKYYSSIHYGSFPEVAPSKYRHVMEYVVNNRLSAKFDLKAAGSVIAAIKRLNNTWLEGYEKEISRFEDEDMTYCMQQLHNRIKSFMKNIAMVYYDAYTNREYISYDKDNIPEDENSANFHLTSNDSFRLQQYVENTMIKLNSSQVDYKVCKMSSDANVKTEEIRGIMEAIFNDKKNIDLIREFITNMIASYLAQSTIKEVSTITFFKYAISPKPNSKDPNIVRIKEIIEQLLDDNSVAYRRRKHRAATRSSYHKVFCTYFAINIINANK